MKKKNHLIREKDIVSVECILSSAETPQSEKFFSLKNAWKTAFVTNIIRIPEIMCIDTGLIRTLSIWFTWRPWQIFHLLSINTYQCKIIRNGVKELLKRTKKSISHHIIVFCVYRNMCLTIFWCWHMNGTSSLYLEGLWSYRRQHWKSKQKNFFTYYSIILFFGNLKNLEHCNMYKKFFFFPFQHCLLWAHKHTM